MLKSRDSPSNAEPRAAAWVLLVTVDVPRKHLKTVGGLEGIDNMEK